MGCLVNAVRVKHVAEYRGDDVVLLAMDGAGVEVFLAALTEAERTGSGRLQRERWVHDIVIEAGAADIEFAPGRVVWRLSREVAGEITERLHGLSAADHPCHNYVDIASPATELVLSRDEYIEPSWLTAGKEPIFGPDDPY